MSPFIGKSICELNETLSQDGLVRVGAPSITGLAVLDVCAYTYSAWIFFVIEVNFQQKALFSKPWTLLRLIGTILLFCGIVTTLCGSYTLQLLRIPLLDQPEEQFETDASGAYHASYHTRGVLRALAGIIIIWGLVGFLFRGYKCRSPLAILLRILTALHLFTSRPVSLLH